MLLPVSCNTCFDGLYANVVKVYTGKKFLEFEYLCVKNGIRHIQ
jgi:hypothetical protein